jgi:PTH1 family peptidyl-tRNA hydrolase
MYIIVGLGNPGTKYRNTYHNMGFMAVDKIAEKVGASFSTRTDCSAKVAKCKFKGNDFILAKPQTFMNLSGESVKQLVKKYGYDEGDLIVIYDDVDIEAGRLRLREEGSAGTHNGMKSIVYELNTTIFKRIRIGIKTDALSEVPLIDYVLSSVEYEVKPQINDATSKAAEAALAIVSGEEFARVQERINRK